MILAVCLALLLSAVGAHAAESDLQLAYLDPGAGSLILQALAAAVAGSLFAIHRYWTRIKAFFSRSDPTDEAEAPRPAPEDE